MATQERIIFGPDPGSGAQVSFVWNDVTLVCSGLHVISGTATLTATVVKNGQTFTKTEPPGVDTVFALSPGAVTIGVNPRNGVQTFIVNGVTSYGFTVGF